MDDKEWRELFWNEMKEVRAEVKELRTDNKAILETMTTLKVKIGVVASIFGAVASFAYKYVEKKIGI